MSTFYLHLFAHTHTHTHTHTHSTRTHTPHTQMVRKMPIEDVVLLDVDDSAMESPHVEDLVALPAEVVSELKHVLRKQTSAYGDTVARSFLRAQVG